MADVTLSQLIESAGPGPDDIIEISQLSTTVTISATTISAQASDNSLNDSANGFAAAGFASGDHVKVVGFTGDTANNIFTCEITDLAPGKMTIGGTDGDVIVDDAAGEMVTISKWVTRRAPRYGKVLLQEITLTSGAPGTFDFNNIPQTFSRLIIQGKIKSNTSASNDNVLIAFNGDTTATNYFHQRFAAFNGGSLLSEAQSNLILACAGETAYEGSSRAEIKIEDYAESSSRKMAEGRYSVWVSSTSIGTGQFALGSEVTAPITRIRLFTDNDPAEQLYGTLRLYGEL